MTINLLATPTTYTVHRVTQSPVFGEGVTHISLDDEAGGEFICLTQLTDSGSQEIRLDFDEVQMVFETCKKMIDASSARGLVAELAK